MTVETLLICSLSLTPPKGWVDHSLFFSLGRVMRNTVVHTNEYLFIFVCAMPVNTLVCRSFASQIVFFC